MKNFHLFITLALGCSMCVNAMPGSIKKSARLAAAANSKDSDYTAYAISNASFDLGTSTQVRQNKYAINQPTNWTMTQYSTDAGCYDYAAVEKTRAEDGTYSFCMRYRWGGARSMTVQQKTQKLPLGRYVLSAYVYAINEKDVNNAYITVMDSAGNEIARSKEAITVNAWSKITAPFFLGNAQFVTISASSKGSNPQSAESKFWFDNFRIISSSPDQYLTEQIALAKEMNDTTALYETSLRDLLPQLIRKAETALVTADDSTMLSQLTPLDSVITAIKGSIDAYAQMKSYVDIIGTAVKYYKRTDLADYYTELNGKYAAATMPSADIKAEIAKKDSLLYTQHLEPVKKDMFDIVQTIDVDSVESSFPVGFAQLFVGDNHYVAYYDKNKDLCVAYRKLTDKTFKKTLLNSKIGWDTHNYVTMIVDDEGYIHVSGNMHNATKIKYWRSVRPYDASEFLTITTMVGTDENSITYPVFLKENDGTLLFHYRQGSSGDGYEVYNKWNPSTQTWIRFLDKPMVDGEGLRNAYMKGPIYANGYYHLYWVWRSTADCSTNHDFSYARSKDLIHWESARGEAVASPIVFAEEKLKVDAPALKKGNGMLNNVQRHAFDSKDNIILCNMKYDSLGNSQLYAYKLDAENNWKEVCLTNWVYRFNFSGIGSMRFDISPGSMCNMGDETIALEYYHVKYGKGVIIFDENTLQPIKLSEKAPTYPASLDSVTIKGTYSLPIGARVQQNGNNLLRWESMAANNDQKPSGTLPPYIAMKYIQIAPKDVTPDAISTAKNNVQEMSISQNAGTVTVKGLTGNDSIYLYDADGNMIAKRNVNADRCTIKKPTKGIYVIKYQNQSNKLIIR